MKKSYRRLKLNFIHSSGCFLFFKKFLCCFLAGLLCLSALPPLAGAAEKTAVPAPKSQTSGERAESAEGQDSTSSVALGRDSGQRVGAKASGKTEVQPVSSAVSEEAEYPKLVIGSGDVLDIQVYGESGGTSSAIAGKALPTEYQVDSDGLIVFPFLGRVRMAGLTPVEAGEKLARLLSKPRKVTVLIKESNTFWVSVMGNVGKPGKYQIKGRPSLLKALAEAGGPLPGSDMGGAILLRNNMKTKVNLDEFLKGEGAAKPEPFLYPGDVLMVQKSAWPTLGEIAIVASILASAAILTVELSNLRR
jgi:polysaccharide export outer membrane protein